MIHLLIIAYLALSVLCALVVWAASRVSGRARPAFRRQTIRDDATVQLS